MRSFTDGGTLECLQISASAPLLQGVKRAVRVSIIAMGAASLAPKVEPVAAEGAAPEEPKVGSIPLHYTLSLTHLSTDDLLKDSCSFHCQHESMCVPIYLKIMGVTPAARCH